MLTEVKGDNNHDYQEAREGSSFYFKRFTCDCDSPETICDFNTTDNYTITTDPIGGHYKEHGHY